MDGFLILVIYWSLNGQQHITLGGMAPTQITCERYGEEGVKKFTGQGAIGAYVRCVALEPKPEGLPEFLQQPKPGPAA
jgi:hypothetical protein